MSNWQYEIIADESAARLPESRYHRMGGWLLALAVILGVWCLSWLFSLVTMLARLSGLFAQSFFAPGLPDEQTRLSWIWIGVILFFVLLPTACCVLSLLMLMKRKIAFRAPFAIYTAFIVLRALYYGTVPAVLFACVMALWFFYVFRSDRVRVFCNRLPVRAVPMPAPKEASGCQSVCEQADSNGTGGAAAFRAQTARGTYRFQNIPSGWRMTADRANHKEGLL